MPRKWRKRGAKASVGLQEGLFESREAHRGVNYSRFEEVALDLGNKSEKDFLSRLSEQLMHVPEELVVREEVKESADPSLALDDLANPVVPFLGLRLALIFERHLYFLPANGERHNAVIILRKPVAGQVVARTDVDLGAPFL